jgi:hypothetical protein
MPATRRSGRTKDFELDQVLELSKFHTSGKDSNALPAPVPAQSPDFGPEDDTKPPAPKCKRSEAKATNGKAQPVKKLRLVPPKAPEPEAVRRGPDLNDSEDSAMPEPDVESTPSIPSELR